MGQIDAQDAASYKVPRRASDESHPHGTLTGDVPSRPENETYGEMEVDQDGFEYECTGDRYGISYFSNVVFRSSRTVVDASPVPMAESISVSTSTSTP
jgi:hypothetical protein